MSDVIQQNPYYQAPTNNWENVNTYAPWGADWDSGDASAFSNPGQNSTNYGSYGSGMMGTGASLVAEGAMEGASGLEGMAALSGAGSGALGMLGPVGLLGALGMLIYSQTGSGKGHKRSSPEYYAPSYQGTAFTPTDSYGSQGYSPETQQQQQQMSSLNNAMAGGQYDYNYGGGTTTNQATQQAYDPYSYASFTPNYIGQTSDTGYDTGNSNYTGQNSLTSTFKAGSGLGQY